MGNPECEFNHRQAARKKELSHPTEELQRLLELNEANENPIERTLKREKLLELLNQIEEDS